MDNVGDNTPDLEFGFGGDFPRRVIVVLRFQNDFPAVYPYPLDGQLAVNDGDDHVFVPRLERTVNHEKVTVMDSRSEHGIAGDPDEEGRSRIFDKVPVQIEPVLLVVGGGGGEARRNHRLEQDVMSPGG